MLRLYNTLTRTKEDFVPIAPPHVGMYNCGPTVYDYAHIGNLRAYVFADILRRTLEINGYDVRQIMNITDVGHLTSDADEGEDKMVKALKREGKPMTLKAMSEVADIYTTAFENDLAALNIEHPALLPRASEHIKEQIELISVLLQKDIAYKTSDGIYFDIAKYPDYGTLGNVKNQELREGARVAENKEKRDQRDFALWKFADGEVGWEAPWGRGFPGWHIECSAMGMKYLGNHFDIHTGGVDHIPVHHNNEIAQSESATGEHFVNYWMHSAFMNVSGGKMAKSEGNTYTLHDVVERGFNPLSYRYLLLGSHYRSPINFTWESLEGAQNGLGKLYDTVRSLPLTSTAPDETYLATYKGFLNDDLNTPQALALMWTMLKDDMLDGATKRATVSEMDRVFALSLDGLEQEAIPEQIMKLANEREELRAKKDFAGADAVRVTLEEMGYTVKDTPSGPEVKKM